MHFLIRKVGIIIAAMSLCTLAHCGGNKNKPDESDLSTTNEVTESAQKRASTETPPTTWVVSYSDWDFDGNEEITISELERGITNWDVYQAWDVNDDGFLDDLEFTTGMYNAWDTDGDEIVDYYELRTGSQRWFPSSYKQWSYSDWDSDGDKELTTTEFREGAIKAKVYDYFDKNNDGKLDASEYSIGVYRAWDTDGDDKLDIEEWHWQDPEPKQAKSDKSSS